MFKILDWLVGFVLFGIVGPILRVCDPKGTRLIKRLQASQQLERKQPKLTPEQKERLWAKFRKEMQNQNAIKNN